MSKDNTAVHQNTKVDFHKISNPSILIIPKALHKIVVLFLFITMVLSACAARNELVDTPTQTSQIDPTNTVTTSSTQTVSPVDLLIENYFSGVEINVNSLIPEEFTQFSARVAERRNAERGISPIVYNGEAYINPDNFTLMNYDGQPSQNETITMFLAINSRDQEGNLQIIGESGELITIENSADVVWGSAGLINDPEDPRLDWPVLESGNSGYTTVQYPLSDRTEYPEVLVPVILLDKSIGEVFLGGQQPREQAAFPFYTIETDSYGNPILLRLILVMPGPIFRLFEEGSSLREETTGGGVIEEYSNFYHTLSDNSAYYVSVAINQNEVYSTYMFTDPAGYQGAVFGNEAFSVLTNQTTNENEVLVITAINIIKAMNE